MSLARRVRTWAGGIGLWRKMAIALAAAALGFGHRDLSRADRRAAVRPASAAPS